MPEKSPALFDLPHHVVGDRVVWRRKMLKDHSLSLGARMYAATLAFHRWGAGCVSWARDVAARVMKRSPRTISRWNAELRDAGWLDIVEEGMPGRQQVFALTQPERRSRKGDSSVTPRGKSPSGDAQQLTTDRRAGTVNTPAIGPHHPLTAAFPHIGHLIGTITGQPLQTPPLTT